MNGEERKKRTGIIKSQDALGNYHIHHYLHVSQCKGKKLGAWEIYLKKKRVCMQRITHW